MSAIRVGSAAVSYAVAQHLAPSKNWTGRCLEFTRRCHNVDPKWSTAAEDWNHVAPADRHSTGTPPPGVPVHWSGGTKGYGHVAESAGGGYCWTTDLIRTGMVDKAPLSLVHSRWGLAYSGWAATIDGVRIYTAPAPKPIVPVHLAAVIMAFKVDPGRPQGHGLHPDQIRPVEHALAAEGVLDDRWAGDGYAGTKTRTAYARYQARLGLRGADADGIPGMWSLTHLGHAHGLTVLA